MLYFDLPALGRGNQPIVAVCLTTQNGGKELNKGSPGDRRSAIEPSTVTGDPHLEVAAIDWGTPDADFGSSRQGIA